MWYAIGVAAYLLLLALTLAVLHRGTIWDQRAKDAMEKQFGKEPSPPPKSQ